VTRIKHAIQNMTQLFFDPMSRSAVQTRFNHKAPATVATSTTGIRSLDKAVGIGGLPQGQITELVGPVNSSSGNGTTLVAARIAAKAQHQQQTVVILDMTRSFDPWQAQRCGLVAPQLLLTRPDTVFDALSSIEQAARSAHLVIVELGDVPALLNHINPDRLATLTGRIHQIVNGSAAVFLFSTTPAHKDPFDPKNYPPGFPLADLAAVRLWLQNESWSFADGLSTAYKASLTVIKNNLALAGKGANINIKLA
jgi:hypothetical protein